MRRLCAVTTEGIVAEREAEGLAAHQGLSDKLAAGVYFAGERNNEWTKQILAGPTDNKALAQDDSWAVRLKGVYTPTDWLKLTASAEYSQFNNGDLAVFRVEPNALAWGFGATQNTADYINITNQPDRFKEHISMYILRSDVDLHWARLVSISGYRDFFDRSESDLDSSDVNLYSIIDNNYIRTFSQELQLVSLDTSPIKWIAGFYYSNQQTGQNPLIARVLPPFAPFPVATTQSFNELYQSYAGFAQATVPLTMITSGFESYRIGGRYTSDSRRFRASEYSSFLDVPTMQPGLPPFQGQPWISPG